ncbi:GntR family transcriptional regulator [Nocardioides sp. W7]|uniref:GntR family transcriptional regulator n=1 Tax=Nocardioides sp. W7 TaxID=2931390 RepID=UPI001FD376A0|nr:GntR family transcriptional regulator [Nocardioides sp. W7]
MTNVDEPQLLRAETLGHQAEAVLRNMILRGDIPAGSRLNEVALSAKLGVSRGPLREAVQRLRGEGLVTVVTHRGAFVRTFEAGEIVDLYELRAALELHAIRLACQRVPDAELAELDDLLDETEEVMRTEGGQSYPESMDFHMCLVSLVGNQALLDRALETKNKLSLARSMSARQPVRAQHAISEHQQIVDSLKKRDLHAATDLMQSHLDAARESALKALGLTVKDPLP